MANLLQDIGMSKVGTSLSDYVSGQRTLAMNEALTTARKNNLEQSTELTRNQLIEFKRQQAENNKMIPFKVLLDRAKIPEARDYIDSLATNLAFVNPDGTIRAGNARQLQEYLKLDMHRENLSWIRLNAAEKEYDKLKKASENPEYAKELKLKPEEVQQRLALATKAYVEAQAKNKSFQEHKKAQAEIELRRAQKAAAEAKRLAAQKETNTIPITIGGQDYNVEPKDWADIKKVLKEEGTENTIPIEINGKSYQVEPKDWDDIYDAINKKPKTGTDYAPDVEIWRNPETGESTEVNVRDKTATENAKKAGFYPVDARARGYLTQEGKAGADYVAEIVSSAAKARSQIVTLNTMDQLLDRFNSGKLSGATKSLAQWANAFGLPVNLENLSAKEAFTAITEQLALQSRNQGEGMVLAGQMSDRDVQFLRNMNPQLIISKGGNKLIIDIRKAIAKRQIEIASLAKKYRDSHKGVLDQLGFNDYVSKNLSKTSIFGIPEGSEYAGSDKETGLPIYKYNEKYIMPRF